MKTLFYRFVCFIFLTLLAGVTTAKDLSRYLQAKNAISNGASITEFSDLVDHPLYAYLASDFYKENLAYDSQIGALTEKFYHAKPVKDLINLWVEEKFNLGQYDVITRYYYDTGSRKTECLYRQAHLNLGNQEKAFQDIEWLWSTTESLPDECDRVLMMWSGSADPNKRFSRARKAYFAKNFNLTNFLMADANAGEAGELRQYASYALNPENLREVSPQSAAKSPYIVLALAELARKDSVSNTSYILQYANDLSSNSEFQKLLNTLAVYLVNRDSAQCLDVFRRISSVAVEKDTEDAIVHYLINNYRTRDIPTFIPSPKYSKAQYWLGRTLVAQGQEEVGKTWWEKASNVRSYYGFLASDKLGKTYNLSIEPTGVDTKFQNNFNQNNNLIRAQLLRRVGDHTNARREILQVYDKMAKSDVPQLAVWLSNKGFYFESIYLFGKIRQWNDVKRRFPTPFDAEVSVGASMVGIPEAWVYAIIRQESTMNRFAVSRSKARGLMQLIPSTARMMADKVGVSASDIYDAGVNVMMGSQYLSDMYNRFGNTALASAAYNAGPGRVDEWTADGIGDIEEWVERIPFKETRKYVKNVLEYRMVYQNLTGKGNAKITDALHEGIISRPTDTSNF